MRVSSRNDSGTGPRHPVAAHVAHVEQAGATASREVLGDDPGPVLHRHAPAGEIHHLSAVTLVLVMQHGSAQSITHETPISMGRS